VEASEKLLVVMTGLDGFLDISKLCHQEGPNLTQYYLPKKQLMASASTVLNRLIKSTVGASIAPGVGAALGEERDCGDHGGESRPKMGSRISRSRPVTG
jgi:hypothetical protein